MPMWLVASLALFIVSMLMHELLPVLTRALRTMQSIVPVHSMFGVRIKLNEAVASMTMAAYYNGRLKPVKTSGIAIRHHEQLLVTFTPPI
jgi:hypothetical protein